MTDYQSIKDIVEDKTQNLDIDLDIKEISIDNDLTRSHRSGVSDYIGFDISFENTNKISDIVKEIDFVIKDIEGSSLMKFSHSSIKLYDLDTSRPMPAAWRCWRAMPWWPTHQRDHRAYLTIFVSSFDHMPKELESKSVKIVSLRLYFDIL